MIINPDNMVTLRGKPVHSDFSKYYTVKEDGTTQLKLVLKVFNVRKANRYKERMLSYDTFVIQVFGHVKDEEHVKGGMAERLLARLSKNVYVTCYCHLVQKQQIINDNTIYHLYLQLDGFRTEGSDIIVQAAQKARQERQALSLVRSTNEKK